MDQMIVVCQAVRRGVGRALLSCDFPFGPVQEGSKKRCAGGDPVRQGGRRRYGQARRGFRSSGRGHRGDEGGDSGVRPVRHHAADGAEVWRHLQRDADGGGRGAPTSSSTKWSARQMSRGGRRRPAELHQLGAGRGPRRRAGRPTPVLGGIGGGPWLDGGSARRPRRSVSSVDALDNPPEPTPTSRRSRWTRSRPTWATCVRRGDRRWIRSEHVDGGDRRDPHPVHGGRVGPAAVDVPPGGFGASMEQLGQARAVSPHPNDSRSCGNGSAAPP